MNEASTQGGAPPQENGLGSRIGGALLHPFGLPGLVFFVAGLLPVLVMLSRVTGKDLDNVVDEKTWSLVGRTLGFGLGAASVALLMGVPYGFLVSRTNLFGRGLLKVLGIVPLFLPPMMIAMTWTEIWSFKGPVSAILVMGFNTFPLVWVFTARAFERIDGRLEDAARTFGGTRAVLRADLGLVLPAALCGACFAFLFAVNDFSVPDYVTFVGIKFNVYADEIFYACKDPQSPGDPVAKALPLIGLTLLALVPALALRRRGAMASLGSGFRRPDTIPLGRWHGAALGFALLCLTLSALVPLGRMVWEAGAGHLPKGFAAAHLSGAFRLAVDSARDDLRNSLVYAVSAATLAVPVALVLAHALERARHGRWLEPIVLLPVALPAILFGIAYIGLWNHPSTADFYDGGGLVVLLMLGRYLPFPVLILTGAVASLSTELEDAGRLCGASRARRLTSIVAPPLRGSLLASWILVFVLCLRELDAAILVPAANHTAMFRVFNMIHFGRQEHVSALALLLVFFILLPGALWLAFGRRRPEVTS